MPHGIDAYFEDLARDRRRIARFGSYVLAAALLAELALMPRAVVEVLNDARRFGYEGQDQYVRRIMLETIGEVEQPGTSMQNVVPMALHAGGGQATAQTSSEGVLPGAVRKGLGPGEDETSLQSRLRAMALEGPVIRSEDLVVEKLVRPEYPEDARNADIEGVVELVALVDTTGTVTEVHIMGGSHQPLLENAATTAVLQCVYRPYRVRDNAERVWAYFRISFSLY